MSQFDELLAQLQAEQEQQSTLAKAMPQEDGEDDEAIQTAAADGDGNPEDEDEGEGADGDEKPMAKSMTIDGEEVEVVDAEQLVKSLQDLTGRVGEHEQVLAKALETTLGTIKAQGDMIKSLSERVEKLSGQGRGRKTVLAITDRPSVGDQPLVKSEQPMQAGEVMAKALAAQANGKLTGLDVARCEAAINSGTAVPADVLAKI